MRAKPLRGMARGLAGTTSWADTAIGLEAAKMQAAATKILSLLMAWFSIAAGTISSPIAFPALEPAAPELQIEPVASVRQSGALHIGQGEVELLAGTTANIVQGCSQRLRGFGGIHAE